MAEFSSAMSSSERNLTDLGVAVRFFHKVDNYVTLRGEERRALSEAMGSARSYDKYEELFAHGQCAEGVSLLCSGMAFRHKTLPDGRRQILGYVLPGDLLNGCFLISRRMDYAIEALTSSTIVVLPLEPLLAMLDCYPCIFKAFQWTALAEESTAREWLLSVGRRTALERVSHLLCELLIRFRGIGLAQGNAYELPMKQAELAEAVALSAVHVNRTLRELRRRELISINGKAVTIHNVAALQRVASFDPAYLHLNDTLPLRENRLPARTAVLHNPRREALKVTQ